ncbi:MAG TPA: hypothetical protein VEH50_01650 [Methylomirabilota bacterium]|jgi:hypothetical protein|nr:hypothetical protein [Methylomirabilota bacterium]
MSAYRTRFAALMVVLLWAALPPVSTAQQQNGPVAAPSTGDIVRIPNSPAPEAPPIPPEEIIQRFAAHEDEYAKARDSFSYHKKLLLEEIGEDGKPAYQAEVDTVPQVGSDGTRYEHLVDKPKSTLKILRLTPEDLQTFASLAAFPLTTDQLPNYTIKYQGKQPLDELQTYIFSVEPKRLDRRRPYFSGVVWVDDHDLAIVKTYGRWVTELGDVTSPELPFNTFETYRQPVGDNWFPAYFRADSQVTLKDVTVPIRLVIFWTDYTPFSAVKTTAPVATPSAGPPAPPR